MSDTNRDRDDDPRPDIQQAVESRKDEAEAAGGGGTESVGNAIGDEDGVSGSRGEVKNQDVTQQ